MKEIISSILAGIIVGIISGFLSFSRREKQEIKEVERQLAKIDDLYKKKKISKEEKADWREKVLLVHMI